MSAAPTAKILSVWANDNQDAGTINANGSTSSNINIQKAIHSLKDAELNSIDRVRGWTLLHWAAHNGADTVITELLKTGNGASNRTLKNYNSGDQNEVIVVPKATVTNIAQAQTNVDGSVVAGKDSANNIIKETSSLDNNVIVEQTEESVNNQMNTNTLSENYTHQVSTMTQPSIANIDEDQPSKNYPMLGSRYDPRRISIEIDEESPANILLTDDVKNSNKSGNLNSDDINQQKTIKSAVQSGTLANTTTQATSKTTNQKVSNPNRSLPPPTSIYPITPIGFYPTLKSKTINYRAHHNESAFDILACKRMEKSCIEMIQDNRFDVNQIWTDMGGESMALESGDQVQQTGESDINTGYRSLLELGNTESPLTSLIAAQQAEFQQTNDQQIQQQNQIADHDGDNQIQKQNSQKLNTIGQPLTLFHICAKYNLTKVLKVLCKDDRLDWLQLVQYLPGGSVKTLWKQYRNLMQFQLPLELNGPQFTNTVTTNGPGGPGTNVNDLKQQQSTQATPRTLKKFHPGGSSGGAKQLQKGCLLSFFGNHNNLNLLDLNTELQFLSNIGFTWQQTKMSMRQSPCAFGGKGGQCNQNFNIKSNKLQQLSLQSQQSQQSQTKTQQNLVGSRPSSAGGNNANGGWTPSKNNNRVMLDDTFTGKFVGISDEGGNGGGGGGTGGGGGNGGGGKGPGEELQNLSIMNSSAVPGDSTSGANNGNTGQGQDKDDKKFKAEGDIKDTTTLLSGDKLNDKKKDNDQSNVSPQMEIPGASNKHQRSKKNADADSKNNYSVISDFSLPTSFLPDATEWDDDKLDNDLLILFNDLNKSIRNQIEYHFKRCLTELQDYDLSKKNGVISSYQGNLLQAKLKAQQSKIDRFDMQNQNSNIIGSSSSMISDTMSLFTQQRPGTAPAFRIQSMVPPGQVNNSTQNQFNIALGQSQSSINLTNNQQQQQQVTVSHPSNTRHIPADYFYSESVGGPPPIMGKYIRPQSANSKNLNSSNNNSNINPNFNRQNQNLASDYIKDLDNDDPLMPKHALSIKTQGQQRPDSQATGSNQGTQNLNQNSNTKKGNLSLESGQSQSDMRPPIDWKGFRTKSGVPMSPNRCGYTVAHEQVLATALARQTARANLGKIYRKSLSSSNEDSESNHNVTVNQMSNLSSEGGGVGCFSSQDLKAMKEQELESVQSPNNGLRLPIKPARIPDLQSPNDDGAMRYLISQEYYQTEQELDVQPIPIPVPKYPFNKDNSVHRIPPNQYGGLGGVPYNPGSMTLPLSHNDRSQIPQMGGSGTSCGGGLTTQNVQRKQESEYGFDSKYRIISNGTVSSIVGGINSGPNSSNNNMSIQQQHSIQQSHTLPGKLHLASYRTREKHIYNEPIGPSPAHARQIHLKKEKEKFQKKKYEQEEERRKEEEEKQEQMRLMNEQQVKAARQKIRNMERRMSNQQINIMSKEDTITSIMTEEEEQGYGTQDGACIESGITKNTKNLHGPSPGHQSSVTEIFDSLGLDRRDKNLEKGVVKNVPVLKEAKILQTAIEKEAIEKESNKQKDSDKQLDLSITGQNFMPPPSSLRGATPGAGVFYGGGSPGQKMMCLINHQQQQTLQQQRPKTAGSQLQQIPFKGSIISNDNKIDKSTLRIGQHLTKNANQKLYSKTANKLRSVNMYLARESEQSSNFLAQTKPIQSLASGHTIGSAGLMRPQTASGTDSNLNSSMSQQSFLNVNGLQTILNSERKLSTPGSNGQQTPVKQKTSQADNIDLNDNTTNITKKISGTVTITKESEVTDLQNQNLSLAIEGYTTGYVTLGRNGSAANNVLLHTDSTNGLIRPLSAGDLIGKKVQKKLLDEKNNINAMKNNSNTNVNRFPGFGKKYPMKISAMRPTTASGTALDSSGAMSGSPLKLVKSLKKTSLNN